MTDNTISPESSQTVESANEIIKTFLSDLKKDTVLDIGTLAVIDDLYKNEKLTHTNLVRQLEERRKSVKA